LTFTNLTVRIVRVMQYQLSGRPLLDTEADAQLFVDREDELRALEYALAAGMNALVVGERGSGVTSLLRHIAYRRRVRDSGLLAVVDGRLASDAQGLLDIVFEKLTGDSRTVTEPGDFAAALASINSSLYGRKVPVRRENALRLLDVFGQIKEELGGRRGTVILDGVPDSEVGYTLFGKLRDELWELPIAWLVGIGPNEEATLTRPPADAFFEQTISIKPLGPVAAMDLVAKRVPDGTLDRSQLETLAALGEGNPRSILAAAREYLQLHKSFDEQSATKAAMQVRLGSLGLSAAALAAELARLGAASASDATLLHNLGWSRSRATQVLKELEAAGLATGVPEPAPGGGRRKIYRLVSDVVS
jgi:hypothetical protein